MRKRLASLAILSIALGACSGGEDATSEGAAAQPAPAAPQVSQAETMEEIWASDLDTAEKARRVQELLAGSGGS